MTAPPTVTIDAAKFATLLREAKGCRTDLLSSRATCISISRPLSALNLERRASALAAAIQAVESSIQEVISDARSDLFSINAYACESEDAT